MPKPPTASTPPTDVSSTPIPSDNAIFSDNLITSSPPSSPPEFPWESTSNTKDGIPSKTPQSLPSAFSVLGKRKPLSPTSDNARLNKKPTSASARKDSKPLTQMQISLGQEVQKKCKACGMEYIASSEEDRKLHDKYHKQNVEGYDLGKEFLSKSGADSVFKTVRKGDDIVAVDAHDAPWRRKRARAALDVVRRELGAVEIPDKQLWEKDNAEHATLHSSSRHTVYMYVRQSRCIGLLLVEQITEGKKVLEPPKSLSTKDTPANAKMSALERLRARRALQEQEESSAKDQPIRLASKATPARLGISRIWTSPSQRGQGVAKSLLDMAVQHFNESVDRHNTAQTSVNRKSQESELSVTTQPTSPILEHITKDQIAFSQPTEAGTKLARKWTGKKYGWLVYIQ